MDGGDIEISENGELFSVWRRDKNLFLSQPGSSETPLGPGRNAVVALKKNSPLILWTNSVKDVRMLAKPGADIQGLDSEGGFPSAITLTNGGVFSAWESGGKIRWSIVE